MPREQFNQEPIALPWTFPLPAGQHMFTKIGKDGESLLLEWFVALITRIPYLPVNRDKKSIPFSCPDFQRYHGPVFNGDQFFLDIKAIN